MFILFFVVSCQCAYQLEKAVEVETRAGVLLTEARKAVADKQEEEDKLKAQLNEVCIVQRVFGLSHVSRSSLPSHVIRRGRRR